MDESVRKPSVGRPATIAAPRETILDHAARLFAEKGYEQTSLNDVAKSVGLSKAAVYHYFPTKQVIYDEIVVSLLGGLCDVVGAAVEAQRDPARKLATFMRAHAAYFEQNYLGFVTVLHGVSGIGTEVKSERQIAVRDRYEQLLKAVLVEAKEEGHLAIPDIALCGKAVLSMLNWLSRWYRPGGPKTAVEIVDTYYAMLFAGLKP